MKLPEGEDENEWLAVNSTIYPAQYKGAERSLLTSAVVDFYNQINLLYGAITEFCSPQSCPEMKATDEFEYLWQDSENYKRPTKMSAPAYIEQMMGWVQGNIDNEQVLPSRIGTSPIPLPATPPTTGRPSLTGNSRRPLPEVLPEPRQADIQAHVPCLRPHLLPPLPRRPRARPRAAPKHQLQAVRALHRRARPRERQGLLGPVG